MNSWRAPRLHSILPKSRLACLLWTAGILAALASSTRISAADRDKPSARDAAAPGADEVNRLLAAEWKKAGVKPARPASDSEFLRRAYLDLVGRIPSIGEAKAFLMTRESDRRGKLIEYLLEHEDYAKNFATIWTNLLIGRGSQGRIVDRAALSGWLRKQFSANRPWTDVVHDLVTASGSNKENGAVNYTLAHLEFDAVPLTSRTTRLFMGQQLQCTQCHDHPSNEWKQGDFWAINAFFKGLKVEEKRTENAAGMMAYDHVELRDEPTTAFARYERRNGMMGVAYPKFLDGRGVAKGAEVVRRNELARLMVDSKADSVSKAFVNRMWAHFLGQGFVNPVDDLGAHNPPVQAELFDTLSNDFRTSGHDVKRLIRKITASKAYQATSVRAKGADKEEGLFNHMPLRPMTPEQLFDSLLTATAAHQAGNGGRSDEKRDAWLRQFLFAFGNDEGEETTSFQGTVPQALMMMNGELMQNAVSGKPGSFLADCIEQAGRQGQDPAGFMVNQIYLAALSRLPTNSESQQAARYLNAFPDSMGVLQDLFWAVLNSNEFILIH